MPGAAPGGPGAADPKRRNGSAAAYQDGDELPDGRYGASVLWVEPAEPEGESPAATTVELVVTAGPHRGDAVAVLAEGGLDAGALVGLPCRLVVEEGRPRPEP